MTKIVILPIKNWFTKKWNSVLNSTFGRWGVYLLSAHNFFIYNFEKDILRPLMFIFSLILIHVIGQFIIILQFNRLL